MHVLSDLKQIKALGFDVDGVMTNGSLILTDDGKSLRTFHIRDGYAIRKALDEGLKIVVISGGKSEGVILRLHDLGVSDIYMGVPHKLTVLRDWLNKNNIDKSEFAYMGDDILDIDCLKHAHIKACPSDAVSEIKTLANYISQKKGGDGCVRELIEQVLKAQNRW